MLLVLHAALAAPPACPEVVPVPTWVREVDQAEHAFAERDEARFDTAMTSLGDDLPCLAGIVEPSVAARYHRLVGLRLYARGDTDGASLAFAAARAADPFGALPSDLIPAGHEARELATHASTPGAVQRVPLPVRGLLYFDGKSARERPVDRPTLVQVDVAGALSASRYLAPGDTMPTYTARSAYPVAHGVLAGLAGALVVGGGVCLGVALDTAATLDGAAGEEPTEIQQRANALFLASATAGALGAAALTVTLVRW